MDHKIKAYNENYKTYNMLLYQKNWGTYINDWYIKLYEDYPLERKEQLNKREGEIIRQIATLNKRIEGRTKDENYKEYIYRERESVCVYVCVCLYICGTEIRCRGKGSQKTNSK